MSDRFFTWADEQNKSYWGHERDHMKTIDEIRTERDKAEAEVRQLQRTKNSMEYKNEQLQNTIEDLLAALKSDCSKGLDYGTIYQILNNSYETGEALEEVKDYFGIEYKEIS